MDNVVRRLSESRTACGPKAKTRKNRSDYTSIPTGRLQRSYGAQMQSDLVNTRSPMSCQDYGIGNFSYDDKYLSDWVMPEAIGYQHLPALIRESTDDWSISGAALDTALERIDVLKTDGMYRGWPNEELSRSKVQDWPSPTASSAQISAADSSMLSQDYLGKSDFAFPYSNKPFYFTTPNEVDIGMETPPLTPSEGSTSPSKSTEGTPKMLPNLAKVDSQLGSDRSCGTSASFIDSKTPTAQVSNPMSAMLDEQAWETFYNQCEAEHADIRYNALSRFKGTASDIDNLISECCHSGECTDAVKMFRIWWHDQRAKVGSYEDKVNSLKMPSEDEAKRDRVSNRLAV
jgi:hypothetical protein